MRTLNVLTPREVEHFIEEGYVILRGIVPREAALKVQKRVWEKLGLSPDDPSGWTKPIIHLQESFSGPDVDAAYPPRLIAAMDDLMVEGRWKLDKLLGWWPVLFPGHAKAPWKPPTSGWHVDGNFFHHHVYSREQGLLSIHLYSDIDPGGGGTAILPRSHKHAARILVQSEPQGFDSSAICQALQPYAREHLHETVEVNGKIGDVALMHPFMLHAFSPNTGPRPRIVCNPCQSLTEHMNLRRSNAADYSPVEEAIVRAAGELLDKAPVTGPA